MRCHHGCHHPRCHWRRHWPMRELPHEATAGGRRDSIFHKPFAAGHTDFSEGCGRNDANASADGTKPVHGRIGGQIPCLSDDSNSLGKDEPPSQTDSRCPSNLEPQKPAFDVCPPQLQAALDHRHVSQYLPNPSLSHCITHNPLHVWLSRQISLPGDGFYSSPNLHR